MLAEGITKGNHQREYIIGTLCQSSGGPIAFASVAYYIFFLLFYFYYFYFFFFAQNLPISRATNE